MGGVQNKAAANKSIYASRADGSKISFISLIFFSSGLTVH
jgi:hypothetical protein